jgi:BolA protein
MGRKETIERKLAVLSPTFLQVTDESQLHINHAGNPGNPGESHFRLELASEQLKSLTKIEQHRLINKLLATEFTNGLHALSINIISDSN